jgi:hypothetical protein
MFLNRVFPVSVTEMLSSGGLLQVKTLPRIRTNSSTKSVVANRLLQEKLLALTRLKGSSND